MFESLSSRLQGITERLRGKARITEADLDVALREIRLALLEADVNFKVVKDFVARVRERALGTDLLTGLNPGQQIVKIVHDELVEVLGGDAAPPQARRPPIGPHDGRPPGLGEDDDRRQARGPAAQGGQEAAPRRGRRLPARRRRPARPARRPDRDRGPHPPGRHAGPRGGPLRASRSRGRAAST